MPEVSANDESAVEMDAVSAAQDLLDLSNGFDYPPSLTSQEESSISQTPKRGSNGTPKHFRHPSSISVAARQNSVSVVPNMMTDTISNGHDLSTPGMHHSFMEDTTSTLAFFDPSVPTFDTTPGIDPFLPDYFRSMPPMEAFNPGQATPRGLLDYSFDLDVGLTDLDLGLLDQYNFQVPFAADTPSTDTQGIDLPEHDGVPVRSEVFKQSIWRYLPQRHRDHSGAEQGNLALSDPEKESERRPLTQRRAIAEKLSRVSRDRLMALVLGTCTPENVKKISSAFPTSDLLDGLIQYFLTAPALDAQYWFHLPTLVLSKLDPILLACVVSSGAAMTPDTSLRKLGFALHEASRTGQARAFEEDNSSIRDLQHLQTLLLQLHTGMWSGISRKMEIAESFLQPLMTMLRRGGRFRWSTWKEISPANDDQGSTLESKWHDWVQQESFLRMIYRSFELDRQSSMALLKPPLLSYSEMQLPLPSANAIWQAKTASAWKVAYFKHAPETINRPSALDSFMNLENLVQHDDASSTYLYMMWGMIWEYRQMASMASRSRNKANTSLILSSRYQELTKQLDDFKVSSLSLSKSDEITFEIMLLHLNAPLDDVQLFAGIEGPEEARSAYPVLRDWIKSASARQALWHAGQILRAAEVLPRSLLCNFNAIAVYHAGLILWAYGFLKRSSGQASGENMIILNSDDALSARRFITLDRGVPAIKSARSQTCTQLNDVPGVMNVLVQLLRTPHKSTEGSYPPLVGNLVQLLEGLRSATK